MKKRKLHNVINCSPCNEDMVEKVIAFAEGTLDEKEYNDIYEHIAQCSYCRYLLEDFENLKMPESQRKEKCTRIAFKLSCDTILPLSSDHVITYNSAPVLRSTPTSGIVDFSITSFSKPVLLRAIAHNNKIMFEIHTQKDDAVYYLIKKDGILTSNVYNGIAVFENIEKGTYIISENKKHFSYIQID